MSKPVVIVESPAKARTLARLLGDEFLVEASVGHVRDLPDNASEVPAGISFGHSGENLCYYSGIGVRGTLEWCHSTFMAEPYPGYFNHIANILNPRFSRVGIGIAQSGGRVKIVWNFAG